MLNQCTLTGNRPTSEADFRALMQPRFQPGNIESNLKLVEVIKEIAAQKGCMAAQVALAWVLDQGDHVVAIPGTTKLANLQTNVGALDCRLTEENRAALNELADQVLGDRYLPEEMARVNQ
jgi:pyridoxine 4-dehydrogenase